MNKNVKLIFLVLVALISIVQAAAQATPTIYRLGSLTHTVTVERQNAASSGYTVLDTVSGTQDPIVSLTLTAVFTAGAVLGNLCISLSSSSAFIPSGELEVRISSSSARNIYGKVFAKTVSGVQTANITYFDGLADLKELLSDWKEPTIRCTLYSKRGSSWDFELPAEFFKLG